MTRFIKNLYKVIAYHLPETELETITNRILCKGIITNIPYKLPINEHIYLSEAFDPLTLTKERKIANIIYKDILNYIFSQLSQNEKDIIGMYKTYGEIASFPYDIDIHRLTSLYTIFDDNNSFTIDTEFGKLRIIFCERNKYGVNDNVLLGYDDELKALIIFIEDGKNITTEDIINLFIDRDYSYIHELQHYIDDIFENLSKEMYNAKDSITYLNDPSEFKANLQMIISMFGKFLFRNGKILEFEKLHDKLYINQLFEKFLGIKPDKYFHNVINNEAQELFRKLIFYLNDENKKEFYKQLYHYTCDYYATEEDIKFDENRKKQELIRLFRLEETFIIKTNKGAE